MSNSDVPLPPAKKIRPNTSEQPREITRDSSLLPSKETEISTSDVLKPPKKKSHTNTSQQPRESARASSLVPSKEKDLLLFGVYMTPGKKKSTMQEPRETPQYTFLESKEMEIEMSLSSASSMNTDEGLKKTTNCLEKEEDKGYGVSTELSLFIADPWIIKKKLKKSDIRRHLYLRNAVTEIHILRYISEDDQKMKLQAGNGMTVSVYDTDMHTTHEMLLKRSKTRQTHYCLTNSWRNDFVNRRGLKIGDEIGLYWDRSHSKLHFRVLSRAITDGKKLLVL